jgi:hypothetical protein
MTGAELRLECLRLAVQSADARFSGPQPRDNEGFVARAKAFEEFVIGESAATTADAPHRPAPGGVRRGGSLSDALAAGAGVARQVGQMLEDLAGRIPGDGTASLEETARARYVIDELRRGVALLLTARERAFATATPDV